ncbi:DUF927 domain-containing protein [Burkholderia sp. COPS]|uniref:DUF927 domain-containing protein n=1 Tax=Burkholderia sp. COPS TaxID=2597663 RepID=UPI001CA5549D|nr:DUF927 domain-containing protein [Burkholderia sp. COPS]
MTKEKEKQIAAVGANARQLRSTPRPLGKLDFEQLAELALGHFDTVVEEILELEGKHEGKEFVAFNPRRRDTELGSFKINAETGVFCDFACQDECRGGDLIALAAYIWGGSQSEAALSLQKELEVRGIRLPSNATTRAMQPRSMVKTVAPMLLMAPIPDGSPELDVRRFLANGCTLENRYDYVNASGELCFVQLRLRREGGQKTFVTLHVKQREDGALDWTGGMPDGLRPLFGLLDLIEAMPEQPVFVVEGEKAARALRQSYPTMIVVTSAGGAQAPAKTDWSPVAERRVLIWPDNDEAGMKYRDRVAALIGAVEPTTRIRSIDPEKLMRGICEVQGWDYGEKAESMQGWDAADVMALGLDDDVVGKLLENSIVDVPVRIEQCESVTQAASADCVAAHVTWQSGKHYEVTPGGVTVWKQQGDQKVPVRVSSCVEILRQLRDSESSGWSLELRLYKPDGKQQTIVVRRAMLSDNKAFRETINDLGVIVYNWQEFHDYLAHAITRNTHDLVRSVGWNGPLYVQANRVYGLGAEAVALDPDAPVCAAFEQCGTLEEWNAQIGRYCERNSRLMLAVCLSLAGPFLHLLGIEPGGVHLVGQSSVGKTTAMRVAASVWGSVAGFVRSWRSTSNGLEAVAASMNDCVLLLDEMNQATPLEAGEVVYMLGNGQGKVRMTRAGAGSRLYQWRLLFMSTGEIPLQQHIESVGKKVRAGMDVRLLNIPADAGRGLGLFESLDVFESSRALADHLNATTSEVYGVAGDQWLMFLTDKVSNGQYQSFCRQLKERLREIERQFPANGSGQVMRAARRFALLALAGELAVEAGIGGWVSGSPTAMMKRCFDEWVRERGGTEAAEEAQALRQVQHFFEQHGQSAFQRLVRVPGVGDDLERERTVNNRAGYVDAAEEIFYVLPEVFRNRVCDGLDYKFVAEVLSRRGMLLADTSKTVRVPSVGSIRAWKISARIVGYSPELTESDEGPQVT